MAQMDFTIQAPAEEPRRPRADFFSQVGPALGGMAQSDNPLAKLLWILALLRGDYHPPGYQSDVSRVDILRPRGNPAAFQSSPGPSLSRSLAEQVDR